MGLSAPAIAIAALQFAGGAGSLWAQDAPHLDINGFAMADAGYDFKQAHPDWFDTMRPTKLPSFKNEFGHDGNFYTGVRQSRLGFRGYIPTPYGELKTIFEFELFGTGVDAGQTTFRLRHAWGELGKFGAGQYWSTFMDPDVFPNQLEYWGPNGILWFRNVQFRYKVWEKGDSHIYVAAERPGAANDQGIYQNRIELQGVKGRFPAPDISGHYRWGGKKGHLQIGGIYRRIQWDDLNATAARDLSGHANAWGTTVSGNVKLSKHVFRFQAVYGEGIQNYFNDAPTDVAIQNNFSNSKQPIIGKALPILGLTGFFDLNWSDKMTSTIGYSRVDIDNTNGQSASSYKSGQYALTNLLFYPVPDLMLGPEFQYGYRDDKGGWHIPDYRIQFSARYKFSVSVKGNN